LVGQASVAENKLTSILHELSAGQEGAHL
jgi:hypothetical protein